MRLIDADDLEFVYAILPKDASEDYKEGYGDGMNYVLDIIDDLPTIDPVKWIPVSETMPNQNERFLVQYEDGEMDVAHCSDVNPFWTNLKTDWHWVGTAQFAEVVAWMPLPEPWKGEE